MSELARLTQQTREIVQDRYAASNRQLSQLTGLDLTEFGYPVAPSKQGGHQVLNVLRDASRKSVTDAG